MQHTPKEKDLHKKNQDVQPDAKVTVNGKNVDPETLRVARENLERYLPAMKELAK